MPSLTLKSTLAFFVAALFTWTSLVSEASALDLRSFHSSLEARYSRAHSLGDDYHFDPRDGWQVVNASNLDYKYSRNGDESFMDKRMDEDSIDEDDEDALGSDSHYTNSSLAIRATKKKAKDKPKPTNPKKKTSKIASKASKGMTSALSKVLDSFKGIGKAEPVTITWYTGHDLENPSCWPNPEWQPSDASFACALTLAGWTTRPKCFKFLELCNTPKKCVFVRVVDSCAGCAKGSKHVDLTQAAFKQLATLEEGLLQVQMRQATDPDGWLENLWGPKA